MPSPYAVFICYRREDSRRDVEHLHRDLSRHLGRDVVFYDDLIPPGESYRSDLLARIQAAKVVLVVIGRNWLAELARRPEENDLVRLEVRTALEQPGVRVIPILIDEKAMMPGADQLPEPLRALAERQAFRIARYNEDVRRLARDLKRFIGGYARWWPAAAIVATLAVGTAVALLIHDPTPKTTTAPLSSTTATEPPPKTETTATTASLPANQPSTFNVLHVTPGTVIRVRAEAPEDTIVSARLARMAGGETTKSWVHQEVAEGFVFEVHESSGLRLSVHSSAPANVVVTVGDVVKTPEPATYAVNGSLHLIWSIVVGSQ
jgi:hypothetical protein